MNDPYRSLPLEVRIKNLEERLDAFLREGPSSEHLAVDAMINRVEGKLDLVIARLNVINSKSGWLLQRLIDQADHYVRSGYFNQANDTRSLIQNLVREAMKNR